MIYVTRAFWFSENFFFIGNLYKPIFVILSVKPFFVILSVKPFFVILSVAKNLMLWLFKILRFAQDDSF